MHPAIRAFATFIAAVAGFYGALWFVEPLLVPNGTPIAVQLLIALLGAGLAARLMWLRFGDASHGLANAIGIGALVTGAAGFVGGFFGPMVLAPDANQGPLLGIFITGPLGVLVGGLGGAVYWQRHRRGQ